MYNNDDGGIKSADGAAHGRPPEGKPESKRPQVLWIDIGDPDPDADPPAKVVALKPDRGDAHAKPVNGGAKAGDLDARAVGEACLRVVSPSCCELSQIARAVLRGRRRRIRNVRYVRGAGADAI